MSWLILDKNSLLALFARSAVRRSVSADCRAASADFLAVSADFLAVSAN